MTKVPRLFFYALFGLATAAGWARAEDRDCPNLPGSTYVLTGADTDADRSQIRRLAGPAKEKGAVCIMAFYDAADTRQSAKLMAFRRATWAMEKLTDEGVSASSVTRVLRAGDKSSERMLRIVLGQ